MAWKLEARRLQGEALHALGDEAEAETLLRATHAAAGAREIPPVVWASALALADLLVGGSRDEAAALRTETRIGLERMAAGLPDDLRSAFATTRMARRARES